MAVPKYHEFMKPLLQMLGDGQEQKIQSLYADLAKHFQLTEADIAEYLPSGRQLLYHNRIGWAKTYLVKAGLLESPKRAVVRITDLGKATLLENPPEINPQYLTKFSKFQEFIGPKPTFEKNSPTQTTQSADRTPIEDLEEAYKLIQSRLQDELLQEVVQLTPDQFERLVVDLVVAMGYGGTAEDAARVVGKTGDEGIDGIIKADRLGFDRIYIQAKKWAPDRTVGRPDIQKFLGALVGQGASKGLFIATCGFSKEASDFVEKSINQRISLVDGKEHPVDSSEMAFKLAAKGAMKLALAKAVPVLLEPIVKLNVYIEEEYLGDILSDLSTKRGRVLGQEDIGHLQMVRALVPQSELLNYAIDLKSMTSGTGSFEMEFDHYEPLTGKGADEVVKAYKDSLEEA